MKYNLLLKYPLVSSVLLVVFCVEFIEMFLLERKYNLFFGGFLQSHQIDKLDERFIFLFISLWMSITFFGSIALIWYWTLSKLKVNSFNICYHYFILINYICFIVQSIHYKILSYFNDTINYTIVKNLAGDSMGTALAYITMVGEGLTVIVLIIILISLGIYFAGLFIVQRVLKNRAEPSINLRSYFLISKRFYIFLNIVIIFTIFLVYFANRHDDLRYGLKKKIPYAAINGLLSFITDFDADGYSYFSFPTDPEPFNAQIYPGALDIPDNGIDEDGIAGDFIYTKYLEEPLTRFNSPNELKHLILVILESTRGDLIGKKIDGQYVAPNLMELAEKGSYFKYTYSHTGWTVSSEIAIFNGSLIRKNLSHSLFSILKENGYEISVFSAQDESFGGISETIGMEANSTFFFDARNQKEERVFPSTAPGSLILDSNRVLQEIIKRLPEIDWRNPQFLYINFQSAHFPYSYPSMPRILIEHPIPRSKINKNNRIWVEKTYWNALAYVDRILGEFIEHLRDLDVFEKSLMVIIGDHGESLFDDGFLGHGHALNEIQTRIPLIFNVPHVQAEEPIGQVDLFELIIHTLRGDTPKNLPRSKKVFKSVFQFTGSLHNPSQIGMVELNEQRTILDLRTRKVFSTNFGRWIPYRLLYQHKELYEKTNQLIFEWEHLRWEDHLNRTYLNNSPQKVQKSASHSQ